MATRSVDAALGPYFTIQAGVNAAVSGDVVQVAAGNYPEMVTIVTSNITLVALGASWPTTFPVTVTGSPARTNCIKVMASNVVVDGFKVTLSNTVGIRIEGPGVIGVEVRNCYAIDTGSSGIACWGVPSGTDPVSSSWRGCQNIRIHHNTLERCCNSLIGPGGNEHITISNGVYNVSVYNNIVGPSLDGPLYSSANGGEGIDFKEGVELGTIYNNKVFNLSKNNGIYLDAGRSNVNSGYTAPAFLRSIHVYNNVVYGINGNGIALTSEARIGDSATGSNGRKGGQIDNIYIDYNTVYGCQNLGISIYDYGLILNGGFTAANVPLANNVQVINNICHGNDLSGNAAYGAINQNHAWVTNSQIRKNVVTGNWSGVHIIPPGTCTVSGNINADPLFANQATANFALQTGSPAVNSGGDALINPTTDYAGVVRVGAPDIGAYELTLIDSPPVAGPRTLNGVQDTPIDSDNAPYYRAKTGIVIPFGLTGVINAQVSFVAPATRGEIAPVGFVPDGLFVGAFVKPAIRADAVVVGFSGGLGIVNWLTLPPVAYDRAVGGTQYVTNVRATYLVDPISQVPPANVTVVVIS